MTERNLPDHELGGYQPEAGRPAHQAGAPTLLPVPSLLRSLLSEHLDPGYAAAAANTSAVPRSGRARVASWGWQAVAALLVAVVFAAAVAQARSTAPGVSAAQQLLVDNVRSARTSTDRLADRRNTLAAQVNALQRTQLNADSAGRQLSDQLDELSLAAGSTPVIGQGLTVAITDPGAGRNLSDVSKQRVSGSQQIILDRDLQFVVNSLWANGAEAIAINDVRIGPNVTIRQAGGAILVDNTPLASPYLVRALGPPRTMREGFNRSPALRNLRNLEVLYGVGVSISDSDGLTLPAAAVRSLAFAKQMGS